MAIAAQTAPAAVSVPQIRYLTRTLPNGLRVIEVPDAKGASVSVQVWYDVGSKDDPTGRSGFAHMFEHLMFKATRNMPPEMIDRLTEDVGGANNASTDDDYTEYHETAPANHLERLLWAEAERMGGLVVDQENFASEREVVKEELRGDLARPYGELFASAYPIANYRVHPYARPTIGSVADLDSATVDDVRAFHALYYRPDNAILIVSGNFDPATLDGWIDRYFGPIAKPNWPIPRVAATEPKRTAPRRYTVRVANTPTPAVVLSWLLPPATDKDHAVVNMIDGILSGGLSARFYHNIIYRDRIASEADVNADFKKATGTINAFAVMASGHKAAEGEAAIRREIARLKTELVSQAELDRVRNLIVTSALKQRETAEGRASILASGLMLEGDPQASDKRLAAIQRVTAADVRRVARTLFTDQGVVTIHYLAPGSDPADRGAHLTPSPTVKTIALVTPPGIQIATALPPEARTPPPAPGAPIAPDLPVPVERRLSNGIRLVVLERHDLPIVTVHLVSPHGTADDPPGKSGLSNLVADLMTKGTTTRDATAIAHTIEAMGGGIEGDAARDGSTLTLTIKSDQLAPAMRLFADVALHPAFAPAEIERDRTEALDQIVQTASSPSILAGQVGARAVYGDGPYGQPENGTAASIRAVNRGDVIANYMATWRPDRATMVMAGDVTPDRAQALAEQALGGWRATTPAPALASSSGTPPKPRVIVVDMPSAEQAVVLVMRPTIARSDPDYHALLLGNTALGGGYSSRLNREVRVKRGLAYGASSNVSAGRLPGALAASTQTRNEKVAPVLTIIKGEMRRLGTDAMAADELAVRKAALIGSFGDSIQTTDGLAGAIANLISQGLPPTELDHYADRIEAVTAPDVQRVARRLIDPGAASVVIVGDSRKFLGDLREAGLKPEVIPFRSIRLDNASLGRTRNGRFRR